jgi:5-methylcytosine-specific restriction endonuclease McrA
VEAVFTEFLKRHDPVEKAKRHQVKKGSPSPSVKTLVPGRVRNSDRREPTSAVILHQVNLRDQRRCVFVLPDGTRCNQSRWTEVHHKIRVCDGGENTLENLITLCSGHHKLMHLEDAGIRGVEMQEGESTL